MSASKKRKKSPKSPEDKVKSKQNVGADDFSPPWPAWNDQLMNKFDWFLDPNDTSGRPKSRAKKGSGGSRKSAASKKSIVKEIKKTGSIAKGIKKSGSIAKGIKKSGSIARKSADKGKGSNPGTIKNPVPKTNTEKTSPVGKTMGSKKRSGLTAEQLANLAPFEDSSGRNIMPSSLQVHSWLRPKTIDPKMEYALDVESDPLDLWTYNQHLLKSKVMSNIIASVMALEAYGRASPFTKDLYCSSYVPNSGAHWKPRDNVYAWTKVGEGTKHHPLYNHYGMYAIRLFFMGKWRRLLIDDYFPYDEYGNLLLPRSRDPRNLWMQLLSKGLLKISSLSALNLDETYDFNPICNLTGWICNSVDVSLMTEESLWKIIQGHLIPGPPLSTDRLCEPLSMKSCVYDALDVFLDKLNSRCVLVQLPAISDESTDMLGCYEGVCLLKSAINDMVPSCNPQWKNYRWVDWAFANGFIRGKPGTVRRIIELFVPLKTYHTFIEENAKQKDKNDKEVKIKEERPSISLFGRFKSDPYLYANVFRYFKRLDIYYKRTYFEYERVLENIPVDIKPNKVLSHAPEKTAPDPNFVNNCFYLISDSPCCKNFFFTLSVTYDKNCAHGGYVVCEGYNWRSVMQGPCWFSIRTKASRTHSVNLGPGQQIVRFWYSLPFMYHIFIHSRSMFYLAGKDEAINMQSVPTSSYYTYGDEMRDLFRKIMKADYGTVHHGELIGKFITSFCPPNVKNPHLPSPADPEATLTLTKLEDLFEEKVVELVLEYEKFDEDRLCKTFLGFQTFFLNPEFGEKALERIPHCAGLVQKLKKTKQDVNQAMLAAKKAFISNIDGYEVSKSVKTVGVGGATPGGKHSITKKQQQQQTGKKKSIAKKSITGGPKSVRRASSGQKKENRRASTGQKKDKSKSDSKTASGASNKSKGEDKAPKEKKPRIENDEIKYSQYLLDGEAYDVHLLRKMLFHEEELLSKYPFRYDNDRRLFYFDYTGIANLETPNFQCRAPIIYIPINVHSESPVPVGFYLFTDAMNPNLELHNLDNNVQLPINYVANQTCYLTKNKNGYAIVVYNLQHLEPSKSRDGKNDITWRVRAFGMDDQNIPHQCVYTSKRILAENESNPSTAETVCKGLAGPDLNLKSETIIHYYFPNNKATVCKFLLIVKRSVVMCLYFSASRNTAVLRMTLKGKDDKLIYDQTATNEIFIPAFVLNFEDAELQPSVDDEASFYYFAGEVIVLNNTWTLKNKDLEVLELYGAMIEDNAKKKEVEARNKKRSSEHKSSIDGQSRPSKPSQKTPASSAGISPLKAEQIDMTGPVWKLTLYAEEQDAASIKLTLDKRYEESFQKKKAVWNTDPHRGAMARNLRHEYLNSVTPATRPSLSDIVSLVSQTEVNQVKRSSATSDMSKRSVNVKSEKSDKKKHFKKRPSKSDDQKKDPTPGPAFLSPSFLKITEPLLPPLIDRYALPLDSDIIPIVIKLDPVPTNAPLQLSPVVKKSSIPDELEENESADETLLKEESSEFFFDPSIFEANPDSWITAFSELQSEWEIKMSQVYEARDNIVKSLSSPTDNEGKKSTSKRKQSTRVKSSVKGGTSPKGK